MSDELHQVQKDNENKTPPRLTCPAFWHNLITELARNTTGIVQFLLPASFSQTTPSCHMDSCFVLPEHSFLNTGNSCQLPQTSLAKNSPTEKYPSKIYSCIYGVKILGATSHSSSLLYTKPFEFFPSEYNNFLFVFWKHRENKHHISRNGLDPDLLLAMHKLHCLNLSMSVLGQKMPSAVKFFVHEKDLG